MRGVYRTAANLKGMSAPDDLKGPCILSQSLRLRSLWIRLVRITSTLVEIYSLYYYQIHTFVIWNCRRHATYAVMKQR